MSKKKDVPGEVRMADVARVAGVAPITVSRALSAPDTVAPETRRRIDEAVRSLGYVGNRAAGSLKSRRSNLVVVVIPSITHQSLASMIQGISEVLGARGYHLVLATSGDSREEEEKMLRAFLAQRPCAAVLHNTLHTDECRRLLLHSGIPVVETGDLPDEPLDIAIGYSNFEASRSMTNHLLRRGYRRIAFVYRRAEVNERTDARINGYRQAIADAGLPADASLLFGSDSGVAGGAQTMRRIIEARPDVDAVFFTGNDTGAGGILECRRQGWAVPGRVAIAGYDDTGLAVCLQPTLTTLRIPRHEIGQAAAHAILTRLAGHEVVRRQDLGFELCERESS
jgi:LacI family gluconate utilization system Gnt-I transcriptional repressor